MAVESKAGDDLDQEEDKDAEVGSRRYRIMPDFIGDLLTGKGVVAQHLDEAFASRRGQKWKKRSPRSMMIADEHPVNPDQ